MQKKRGFGKLRNVKWPVLYMYFSNDSRFDVDFRHSRIIRRILAKISSTKVQGPDGIQ